MTTTTTDERLDALIAQLAAMGVLDAPQALAGELPPTVTAGQLITSAWGNATVAELTRLRAEAWAVADHAGVSGVTAGAYDLGTTTLGPFAYPVTVAVVSTFWFGFSGGWVNAVPSVIRLVDGAERIAPGMVQVPVASTWLSATIPWAWTVPAGQAAGFRTRVNIAQLQAGGAYANANTLFKVQRHAT
ncbi:MAG: hypothetical protein ABW022_06445 [Actinoplanes sp.]